MLTPGSALQPTGTRAILHLLVLPPLWHQSFHRSHRSLKKKKKKVIFMYRKYIHNKGRASTVLNVCEKKKSLRKNKRVHIRGINNFTIIFFSCWKKSPESIKVKELLRVDICQCILCYCYHCQRLWRQYNGTTVWCNTFRILCSKIIADRITYGSAMHT